MEARAAPPTIEATLFHQTGSSDDHRHIRRDRSDAAREPRTPSAQDRMRVAAFRATRLYPDRSASW